MGSIYFRTQVNNIASLLHKLFSYGQAADRLIVLIGQVRHHVRRAAAVSAAVGRVVGRSSVIRLRFSAAPILDHFVAPPLQIARNLVTGPRLAFMDEPTGGLDVSVQARLLDLLRGLVRDMGLSAVIVTHDLAVVRLLADRLMVMKSGRVVETGLTDQVLDDPQHGYTQLLVSSVLQV